MTRARSKGPQVVCVCGMGIMGSGIAARLRETNWQLRLYNRTRSKAMALAGAGVEVFDSPAAAAEGADFVITSVSDDAAAYAVWQGPEGILAGLSDEAIAIETSTLSVAGIDTWVDAVCAVGASVVDCPVTGSREGVTRGELYAFIGADPEVLHRAWPLLSCFCSDFHCFGAPGRGTRFKLVYNLIGAGIGAIYSEGLILAEHLGIDPSEANHVVRQVGWGAAVARSKGSAMVERRHDDIHYRIDLMHKDIRYALTSRWSDLPLPCAELVEKLYAAVASSAHAKEDISAVRESFDLLEAQRTGGRARG